MKKVLYILIILIPVAGLLGYKLLELKPSEKIQTGAPVLENRVEAETVSTPLVEVEAQIIPVRLIIPKLGVDVFVEHVAEDNSGRMDVPVDPDNVAWWELGYKPGQAGSAVIAGHYDNPDGSPSVFYSLGDLSPGDNIIVEDSEGTTLEFAVTDIQMYKDADFPIETVFGTSNSPRLNLITCAGVFDKSSLNYSDRLVVFAEIR